LAAQCGHSVCSRFERVGASLRCCSAATDSGRYQLRRGADKDADTGPPEDVDVDGDNESLRRRRSVRSGPQYSRRCASTLRSEWEGQVGMAAWDVTSAVPDSLGAGGLDGRIAYTC
jgi:hypothetical protein